MADISDIERSPGVHVFRGSIWMIALRWAIRLIGLGSTVLLARLLVPADFGIVAMAMLFVGMLELLGQGGQKLAIIRHQNPSREDYDTAWTISVLVGLVIAGVIVLVAPFTPAYFHEPRAVPVMQCLALRAVLGGFENIGVIDFRRSLRFDRFFLYNVVPKVISVCVTVLLALLWRNYWALVAGILVSQVSMLLLSYSMHPYRPHFSVAKFADMYAFSGWTLFRTIGFYFSGNIDQLAIGGFFGANAMGRYSVAEDLAASPLQEINTPMVAVLYPVMSRLQQNAARLRELYLRALSWSAVICAAVSVGVTLVAHDLVFAILGPHWAQAEPLMGWLALSAGLLGLSSGAYATFDALGKPDLGARMQWTRLIMLGLAVVAATWFMRSGEAIAAARFAVTAAFMPTLFIAVGREISVSIADYVSAIWRPLIAAAFMAGIISSVNHLVQPGATRLLLDTAMGGVSFTVVLLALWGFCGRPAAPEEDIVRVADRLLQQRLVTVIGRSPRSRAPREEPSSAAPTGVRESEAAQSTLDVRF